MTTFIWNPTGGEITGRKADYSLSGSYRLREGEGDGLPRGAGKRCGETQRVSVVIAVDIMCLYIIPEIHQTVHLRELNFTKWKLELIPEISNSWDLSESEFLTSSLGGCFIHSTLGATDFNNLVGPYKLRIP